ncbi:MAG: hypothetical protein KDK99_05980 [Verrucomicrobiales bacterium]|nr:hypothetical protein [Verrucomicrobiales bacterium]
MSDSSAPAKNNNASFLWVLGAFFGFAVILYLFQFVFGTSGPDDPRMSERLEIKKEVLTAQNEMLAKTGLTDDAKRAVLLKKSAQTLASAKPVKSGMVVPGSPTQLKQAAAPAPAPAAPAAALAATPKTDDKAPAAPKPAAATQPAAPKPAPAKPAAPKPAPAASQSPAAKPAPSPATKKPTAPQAAPAPAN